MNQLYQVWWIEHIENHVSVTVPPAAVAVAATAVVVVVVAGVLMLQNFSITDQFNEIV